MTGGTIRTVVIVDDDPIVRKALRNVLVQSGRLTPVALLADGAEAVRHAASDNPADAYLLDLHMTDIDGLAATMQIKAARPRATVVILTAMARDSTAKTALAMGADAFLLKTAAPAEIVAALMGGESPTGLDRPAAPELSERETQVLQRLCEGRSTGEIAASLYLSESRVKAILGSVMTKLEAETRLQAVTTGLRLGLCHL